MEKEFTDDFNDDIMDMYYRKWEEIPVSSLKFSTSTSQYCYVAVNKKDAANIINTQALPVPIYAYEYPENIKITQDNVILGVQIDTSNILDLTSKNDYTQIVRSSNQKEFVKQNGISILREVEEATSKIYKEFFIRYKIFNNSAVQKVVKL